GQICEQRLVLAQVTLRLCPGLVGLLQVFLQLPLAVPVELQRLLDAADIGTDAVIARLHLIETVVQLGVLIAPLLDLAVGVALLGNHRLQRNRETAYFLLPLPGLGIQALPAQGLQLGLELTFLGLPGLVLLGSLRLAMQVRQLTLQLLAQVGQTLEVLMGTADAILGFAPALLVFGDAGGLFDEQAELVGLGLDELGNHALFDDRIAARPQPGAEEDVGNVPAAAFGTVEEVLVLPFPGHLAAAGDLVVAGVFALEGTVAVVEDQRDGGLTYRLAGVGAVEDDVGHRHATQVLRRALAHDPAHRINDVGLAKAIGPHHCRHIAREVNGGRIHEGLEACQFDAFQSHGLSL